MGDREKGATGRLSEIDRLSDLPDSILHYIISYLGTKEACRTSILSKRWVNIWSTGFILDFNPCLFENLLVASMESSDKLVSFIEATMQRYCDQNLSIRKLGLVYPNVYTEMTGRIDRWLRIALKNQVQDLSLNVKEAPITTDFLPTYVLPTILFSAKSLIRLKCCRVRVPWCESVMLMSLQSLDLSSVDIDDHMLHHIIMLCPLKKLCLNRCFGITDLSIPVCSKLEFLDVDSTIPIGGSIKVETSSIQYFCYCGGHELDPWRPFNFSLASKKNLSELHISFIHILDNVVDKLVSELSLVRRMSFTYCTMPNNIRIASLTVEELKVTHCRNLVNIALDAPQLKIFLYSGDLPLTSVTSNHSTRNVHLNLILDNLDTQSLVRINRILSRSKCCKVLTINHRHVREIEIDMDALGMLHAEPPYEVEELKLNVSRFISEKSSQITVLDAFFWTCRPSVLSLSIIGLRDKQHAIVRAWLDILQEKVKCWKHPLKRIETQATDKSSVFSPRSIDLRLRLFW